MADITIGDIHLISDGNTLTISGRHQPDKTVCLNSAEVEQLIDFVSSLAGTGSHRRQSFRVPLNESSGLTAQIRTSGQLIDVTPTSLSLTGVFVVLHPDHWIDLAQGDIVEVFLEFEGETHMYHGSVRRREVNGYGLFITESMNGEQIEPPPDISDIVMELQRRWMARRAKSVR